MSTIIQKPQKLAFDVYANNPFSLILQFAWGRVPPDLALTVYNGLDRTPLPGLVPALTALPAPDQVLVSWTHSQVQTIGGYTTLFIEVSYNGLVQGSGPLRATLSTVTGLQVPVFQFRSLAGEDILIIVDDLITLLSNKLNQAAELQAQVTADAESAAQSLEQIQQIAADFTGWVPVAALVTDGTRIVYKVVDWTGGHGTKPTINLYLGAAGFVTDIAQAVSIRGPQGEKGDKGDKGWAPQIVVISDGDRRVHKIIDWTGGEGNKPAINLYLGSSGLVSDIVQAVDVRGMRGLAAWIPIPTNVADGERIVQKIIDWDGGEGTKPPVNLYIGASGLTANITLATDIRGAQGNRGYKGWSAVLANIADGARVVQQVIDWTGGEDSKPASGQYIGATGLVSLIANATDIRGATGATGNKGWSPVISNVVDGSRIVQQVTDWTGGEGAKPSVTPALYVSPTGFTSVIANATDIRGAAGPQGPSVADGTLNEVKLDAATLGKLNTAPGGANTTNGPAAPAAGSNANTNSVYFHNLPAVTESVLTQIQLYVATTGVFKFKVLGQNTDGTLYTVQDFSYTAASTGLKTLAAGTDFASGIVIPAGGFLAVFSATTGGGRFTFGGSNIPFYGVTNDFWGSGVAKGSVISGAGALNYNYTITSKALATKIHENQSLLPAQIAGVPTGATTPVTDAKEQIVGHKVVLSTGSVTATNNVYMPNQACEAGKVSKVVINVATAGTLKLKTFSVNSDGTMNLYNEVSVTISSTGIVTLLDGTDFSNLFMPAGGYFGVLTPTSGGAGVTYLASGGGDLLTYNGDPTGNNNAISILNGYGLYMQATITLGTIASRIRTNSIAAQVKRDMYDSAEGVLSASGLTVAYSGSLLYTRGGVAARLQGTINAAATGVSTNKRVDVLQVNPNTRTVSIVQGTERTTIDATEDAFRAKPTSGNLLLGHIFVVNATATVVNAGTYEGQFRRGYEAELLRCIHLGRNAVAKTTKKLIRGNTVTIAGYGDSITAIQNGSVTYTANGASRDRVEYLSGWASDALPTTYDTGDGAGQTHVRIGWNWQLKAFLEKKYGATINYSNYGYSGTTSANTTNNGLWPARIAQITADAPDMCTIAFGMNEIGDANTYANVVSIATQMQTAGIETIIMGCPRIIGTSLNNWRFTNNQLKRAAIDTGSAFVPVSYFADDSEFFGIDAGSFCNANRFNHPGTRELRLYGEMLTMFF